MIPFRNHNPTTTFHYTKRSTRVIPDLVLKTAFGLMFFMSGILHGAKPVPISYLVGLTDDHCVATGCEWRRYDAKRQTDDLIIRLNTPPHLVGWTADLSVAYYFAIDGLYQILWTPNSKAIKIAALPVSAEEVTDLWIERDSLRWRLLSRTQSDVNPDESGWELAADGHWQLLKFQHGTCISSQIDCEDLSDKLDHRVNALWSTEISEAMLLRSRYDAPEEQQSAVLNDPMRTVHDRALVINADMGDTWHIGAPLVLKHRNGKPIATLIPDHRDREHPYSRQLQVMESDGLLLVGDEYYGTNSVVFNLRSGSVVHRFPVAAHEVIWLKKPVIRIIK